MSTHTPPVLAVAAACVLLTGLGAAAKPAAKPPAGHAWIDGVWESPWRPDQLRKPGEADAPVEVGPPPLKAAYLADWSKAQKASRDATARGAPIAGGVVACIPPGFPAMMSPRFPMEFISNGRQVNITNEAYAQTRRVYLGAKQTAVEDTEPGFFGHSVGHWEGSTLVIDTLGIKDYVRQNGVPHSPEMRVIERLHPTGPDTFEDDITVTDPQYLERPWTFTFHYLRKPDYPLGEYVCENNHEFADPVTGAQKLRLD